MHMYIYLIYLDFDFLHKFDTLNTSHTSQKLLEIKSTIEGRY